LEDRRFQQDRKVLSGWQLQKRINPDAVSMAVYTELRADAKASGSLADRVGKSLEEEELMMS